MSTHTLNADVVQVGSGGSAPAFQNGWSSLAGWAPIAFWKDAHGHVHLRGVATGGTGGTTAFTLPAGFRPANKELFAAAAFGAAASVTVLADGEVQPSSGGANFTTLSLTFLADN